jgi:hypothetical protein
VRTYSEAFADARDEPPFSNGTEGYDWMENWCWAPCHTPVEKAWQECEAGEREAEDWFQGGCPLILVAMMGRTPSEWLPQSDFGDFHCIEFRGPDDLGGDEPQPVPDPPGMDALFERPEPQVRMLVQPEREQVLV